MKRILCTIVSGILVLHTIRGRPVFQANFCSRPQTTMPRFFSGAGKMFRSSDKLSHIRKTKHTDPVSDETIRKLESTRVWKMENDFYEFAAAQFNEIKASFEGFQSGKTNFHYEKIRPR